jgi:hypothetical protein
VLGYFPTREVAEPIARERADALVVHLPDGKVRAEDPRPELANVVVRAMTRHVIG